MKKAIFTLSALFAFAIASAQTDSTSTTTRSSSSRMRTERTDRTQEVTPGQQQDTAYAGKKTMKRQKKTTRTSTGTDANPATTTPRREKKK